MPGQKELYSIITSPEYQFVQDLLSDKESVANAYSNDPDGFLKIEKDGLTNRDRIEVTYIFPGEELDKGKKSDKLPLKPGTLLYVEYDKINEMSFVTEGIEVVSTNEPAFKAKALAALEADKGYTQILKPIAGKFSSGTVKTMLPEVTVWMWCRSLSPKENDDKELTGQIFDLSPFIRSCTTNMSKNGGNFSLSLPPLTCELDSERKWILRAANINTYGDSSPKGQGYVAQSMLLKESQDGESFERTQFLFHNMIGPNDLVFIRFETLDMERDQRYSDLNEFFIGNQSIPNRIYDMIGLVDSNTQSVTAETLDVSTNIQGRDLSKLFIEDGTYFFALENSQGILKFAGQSEQKNSLVNRIYGDGALQFLFLYMHSSIELILKFIIQQLSNMRVVPDHLFSQYGDRINKRFNTYEKKSKSNTGYKKIIKEENASGIWQIIKLVIDESVSTRRIQDSSFSSANGSILNFIHAACQPPLVEVYMDTYGDQYHLIVRKPPHDQKALISLIEGKVNTEDGTVETPPAIVDIEDWDVLQETLSFDDSQVYSWYHFFPKNNFFGDANSYSLSYMGALFFEEYAQLYGSKPFQQCHPYIPYAPYNESKKGFGLYERQAIEDLKYVVESSQYLPFTRKGKLTLNRDRRIKIGNVIRYKSTGEIFFVDAVQQSYQISEGDIQATTVVSVSRGMIEQLIYGTFFTSESGERRHVSYFNIINTDLTFEEKDTITKVVKRRVKKVANKSVNVVAGIRVYHQKYQSAPFLIDNFGNAPVLDNNAIIESGNKGTYLLEKYNNQSVNKNLFVRFINEINAAGYNVIITDTGRSYAQQAALKKQNILNAAPGHSTHESYSAIDLNLVNKKTGITHTKNSSHDGWVSTGVPAIAKNLGMQWAGGDGSFGSYVDRVHFQIIDISKPFRSDAQAGLETQFEEYTMEEKSRDLDRDKVFSNFKTNKFSFNFFLKRLQFGSEYKKVANREWQFRNDAAGTSIAPIIRSTKK